MSATDTNKLRARVATLDKLLDDFDGQLDDLLAKSLPETLLGLDTLQQAKLQVTIPYLVYDLVISASLSLDLQSEATETATFLNSLSKDEGDRPQDTFRLPRTGVLLPPSVDLAPPNSTTAWTHRNASKNILRKSPKPKNRSPNNVRPHNSHTPTKCLNLYRSFASTERTAIDKAAANRFIKHAISQAVRTQGQTSEPTDQEPTPGPSKIHVQAQSVPAGATKKMLARAEWEKQVQVAAEEEEEDLEIFEEAEGQAIADADVEMTDDKASAPPLPVRAGETGALSEQQSGMCIS